MVEILYLKRVETNKVKPTGETLDYIITLATNGER
jgi:hypothetical protein